MHIHILAAVLLATTKAKSTKTTSAGGGYEELIFIGLIVLAAWLLFFRPRSRQAQNQRQLLSTLVPGDEVLTGAGIYGTVLDVYPDRITIETAPGTRMTVSRSTVARKVDPAGTPPGAGGPVQAELNGHGSYAPDEQDEYDEDDEYDDDGEQDEYDDEEQGEYDEQDTQDEYDDDGGEQDEHGEQDEGEDDGAAHGDVTDGAVRGDAGGGELDDPGEGGADVGSGGGKGRRR